jgi:hypothetical protein
MKKRQCGWEESVERRQAKPVWARRNHVVNECPRSYISAESQTLIEQFNVWKLAGGSEFSAWPARVVEAMCILEQELRQEARHGNE